MIYSTNWIERFNKSVKRTTKIRNSFPSPESAIALIGFVAMDLGENHYNYPIKIFAGVCNVREEVRLVTRSISAF